MSIDVVNGRIRVYNFEESPCGFTSITNPKGNYFSGREPDSEFVVERILWEDIESENRKSDLFRMGRLRFNPEEEEEIYNKLGITDKENIMTDKQLIAKLKDDSIENIKYIAKIKSHTLIKRMKQMLFKMERTQNTPPHGIIAVVKERNNELKGGYTRNENSVINNLIKKDQEAKEESRMKETIQELKTQIQELSKPKDDSKLDEVMAIVKALQEENERLRKESVASVKNEPKATDSIRKPRKTPTKKEESK